ncbi:TPA: IS110 family transposase, partial [Providencia alcalifaciens]
MNEIKVIGIDLAKSALQVCVWISDGNIASNHKVSRAKLLDTIPQFPPGSIITMETCATSHYWGRTFQSIGFQVRLIPMQHVKALTHHQKN